MPPRQLNRRLITLRARITKEGLVGTRVLAQPCRQLTLLGGVVQITDVVEGAHLIADGLG